MWPNLLRAPKGGHQTDPWGSLDILRACGAFDTCSNRVGSALSRLPLAEAPSPAGSTFGQRLENHGEVVNRDPRYESPCATVG